MDVLLRTATEYFESDPAAVVPILRIIRRNTLRELSYLNVSHLPREQFVRFRVRTPGLPISVRHSHFARPAEQSRRPLPVLQQSRRFPQQSEEQDPATVRQGAIA